MTFVSTAAQGQGGTAGGDLTGTYPNPSVAAVATAILGSGASGAGTVLNGDRTWSAMPTASLAGFPNDVTKALKGNGNWNPNSASLMAYGDGSDGDVTVTGGTTTLTRDMYYNSLTVTGTGVLACNTFRVFVRTLLTVNNGGIIDASGNPGNPGTTVGGTGGTSPSGGGPLGNGTAGAPGQVAAAGGASTGLTDALGGNGGTGGSNTGGPGTGGGIAAGGIAAPNVNRGGYRSLIFGLTAWLFGLAGIRAAGGVGGSGGWGSASNGGGGGGGGGAVLLISALAVVSAGTIRANGGTGGAGGGSNAGGGGGGGGGLVILMADAVSNTGTLTANGGTGGAGIGTGQNGANGAAGTVLSFANA